MFASPWQRALHALQAIDAVIDPAEPLRFVLRRAVGGSFTPVLDFLEPRVSGNPRSASRYRWELSHRVGVRMPPYAPSEKAWIPWRQGEAHALGRDAFEVESRLLLPIIIAENLDALLGIVAAGGPDAARAGSLLEQATPIVRRDLARYIAVTDAWEDTFALWCITRTPRVVEHLHSLAVALAVTYASGTPEAVRGMRFPYYDKPLPSASAQLASAQLALGMDLETATALVAFVRDARRPSGAWSDDADREDPLTTLIAADLLVRTDPSFDLAPTLAYFVATQDADGLWRALGPDAPWLTAEILDLAAAAAQPFAARFRWPHCGRHDIDQKTGAPVFAHFLAIAKLLAALPGLAAAPLELGFIDLIGFRTFNNRYGQDAGDRVLELFATELAPITGARIVRDGGDEFLVVGAPSRPPLEPDLRAFMAAWKQRFHACFGADVAPVLPRIVVGRGTGATLRALRERLGREITTLKDLASIPETGVLVTRGE